MKKSHETILGISFGIGRIGVAVGNRDELLDWQVKAFDERNSALKIEKICRVMERIILHYGVTGIALKAPRTVSRNKAINSAITSLSVLAIKKGISFQQYDLDCLVNKFVQSPQKTKKKLASAMLHKYPELRKQYSKIESGRRIYYLKLFEAVAAMELTFLDMP